MFNHDMESSLVWQKCNKKAIKASHETISISSREYMHFSRRRIRVIKSGYSRGQESQDDPKKLSEIVGMPWDAARTSIPWTEKGTNLWLKPTPEQCTLAASVQATQKDSMLNATKDTIQWRKSNKILNLIGYLDFIETKNSKVIAFIRSDEERKHKLALAFSFTDERVTVEIPYQEKIYKKLTLEPYQMQEIEIA